MYGRDHIRALFPQYSRRAEFLPYLISSISSEVTLLAVPLFVSYPFRAAHIRLASDIGVPRQWPHHDISAIFSDAFARSFEGCYSLFRGYTLTLVTTVLRNTFKFDLYQHVSASLSKNEQTRNALGSWLPQAAASVATIALDYAFYPLETVARRLQVEAGQDALLSKPYDSAVNCFRRIQREEGLTGFYKGAYVNVYRSIGYALAINVYSRLKNKFRGDDHGVE